MCIFPCFVNRQHVKMRNENFLKGREREIFSMTGGDKSHNTQRVTLGTGIYQNSVETVSGSTRSESQLFLLTTVCLFGPCGRKVMWSEGLQQRVACGEVHRQLYLFHCSKVRFPV